jgi:hypothetical protein
MKCLGAAFSAPQTATPARSSMQTHDLQAFSYHDRQGLLPALTSASTMEFRLEIQLQAILELYSSLVAAGVELTRDAHHTLTGLCTSHQHVDGVAPGTQVLTIRLELSFLEDVTLHSLLNSGSGQA